MYLKLKKEGFKDLDITTTAANAFNSLYYSVNSMRNPISDGFNVGGI